MFQFIKKLFSGSSGKSIEDLLAEGAIILDVRTEAEFNQGHLKRSINIPLNQLKSQLDQLDSGKPVITCCASGMRSASAKSILKSNGFGEVRNGGGWASLKRFDV